MIKVAIVGKVNVGKSTILNSLVKSNVSITWHEPGTTRDIVEAIAHSPKRDYLLMDSGGFKVPEDEIDKKILEKTYKAIEKADIVIAVFDGKKEMGEIDYMVRDIVFTSKKPFIFVVNKIDSKKDEIFADSEYTKLGAEYIKISARYKINIDKIFEELDKIGDIIEKKEKEKEKKEEKKEKKKVIRLTFIGRPNVGKSSLINAILKYPRCIVSPKPLTTRDSIRIPFEYNGVKFIIVDNPGIRRKSRIERNSLEFKSVGRALTALEVSDACVLVVSAEEGITKQDKKLISILQRRKKPFVIAVNKIDLVDIKKEKIDGIVYTSAKTGEGVEKILKEILKIQKQLKKQ